MFKKNTPKDPDSKEKKPLALQYTKRVLRDAFLLMAVVVVVSWGQSFKFSGKYLDQTVFAQKLPSPTGETQTLGSSSKFILVYVFAPWCKVCHANADVLNQLRSRGYEVKGLAMSYEGKDDVALFIKDTGFQPPVLMASEQLEQELTKALGVKEFPTYIVFSPNGEVLTGWSGYTTTLGLWVRLQVLQFFSSHLV